MYRKLKKISNHSDPFIYDQRINGGDGQNIFFYDENDKTCNNTFSCKNALMGVASTWQKVINVFSFDWKMDIGSMIANFNYLMMLCSDKDSLQISEDMWAPNNEFFTPTCILNEDAIGFNEFIQTITEEISKLPFNGIYLNDLVGYLGYSSTFDLSSLNKDKYMYNARNLHPIQGMDIWKNVAVETWKQCNYWATYQNWAKHTSKLDENNTMGKIISKDNRTLILYI